MKTLLAIAFLIASIVNAATVEDLSFLAGSWHCKIWGGEGEEFWSRPAAGTIVGMWRFVKGGKLVFTEHILIEQDAEGPVLRLKHFNPGMVGWEEKDVSVNFRLEKTESNSAVFSYIKGNKRIILRYARQGNDLRAELINETDGKRKSDVFEFTAIP